MAPRVAGGHARAGRASRGGPGAGPSPQRRPASRVRLEADSAGWTRAPGEKDARPACQPPGFASQAGGGAGVSAELPYLVYSVVPTGLREQGVRGLLSLDDHAPPHVHCFVGDGEVVVDLEPAVAVREEHGRLTVAERRRVLALVQARRGRLLRRWRRIHGR